MSPHHLILTVDYEVFGDGSGNPATCIIKPAERIIQIASKFGAKVTFFVEVLEFMEMEKHEKFKKVISNVKQQLREFISNGHDVQLHLHPQWREAKLDSKGRWQMNMGKWRIGDLPYQEIIHLLREGKHWMESLIQKVKPDYRCVAFRAGGWCIQPSHAVIRALVELGFRLDSTVSPGLLNGSNGEWFDFRQVPSLPFWRVVGDVCATDRNGLLELPIATCNIGWRSHLSALYYAKRSSHLMLDSGCDGSYAGPGGCWQEIKGKLSKLSRLGDVKLDFSAMPPHVLIEVTKVWIEQFKLLKKPIPIVAIAHTKNFTHCSEQAFESFLRWATDEGLQFSTYGEWLEA